MNVEGIKSGDRVSWMYRHHLNSRSSTAKTKHGDYYGKIKHTYRYDGPQLAVVKFDGNKRASRVPFEELIHSTSKGERDE
ncbi:MAG: hypothetical protein ABUJ92_00725 [Desulfobacterales bacterium]